MSRSDGSLRVGDLFTEFGNHSAAETAPTSTLASAMLFGTIIFTATSLAARSYLAKDTRALRAAQNPRSQPLDVTSFSSVYALLHHLSVFGVILFYAYICEHHPPYPHSNKSYDRDEFFFLTILLMVASSFTWQKNDEHEAPFEPMEPGEVAPPSLHSDVLNRHQTEEWKGWMQFMFLFYHYYHAEEAYNLIRILITCYVWMTGFGNFSFFYLKRDYGMVRMLQMLWRLNFLVLFLCFTQGTTYILYYICPLHTYYFLMVYATMRVFSSWNYTKWGLRTKMGILAAIIVVVWDLNTGIFKLVHWPFLGETPVLGATSGTMYEWYFRSSLDHWSTFLGMVFALNYPITSLFFRKLEAQPIMWEILAKGSVGVALWGAFWVWYTGPFQQTKLDYNASHAYFGFIPLIAYIYARNLTPWLRAHSLNLLHQIGKTTLETYLMQHHIWLTSNAKSLLTIVPGWPKVNMLIVTLVYFFTARRLYQLTLYLRGIVLPNDKKRCLRNLGILVGVIFGYYALAFALNSFGILNLTTVGLVSLGLGFLLYQACMDMTWEGFKETALANHTPTIEETMLEKMVGTGAGRPQYDSHINVVSAPLVGAMVVVTLGLIWHGMAQAGAASIGPLPEGCESFVNQGTWIPLDACNEESRGVGYRDYGIESYATCAVKGNTFVWGWNDTDPSSHCRFTHRNTKSLRKALKHRTITYVGDSITRHVYHASLRQMGMAGAGAYNTKVPKWQDISNNVGDTSMEFEWAALATDQVLKMKDINARPEVATADKTAVRPDLVVMGGGAWDRLHYYATDEDRESHRATVVELVKEMKKARSEGIPVVWMVPTTINSKALMTEEKQNNIKEEDMAAMRSLYDNLGVTDAASFVLDGPSWSSGRVSESHDGVHYPLAVYDTGAQILANSLDWVLPERDFSDDFEAPETGSMSNPSLALMMLCFLFMGLACFDGFMGFSYLASFFVSGIMPSDLCDEAFDELHYQQDLPRDEKDDGISLGMTTLGSRSKVTATSGRSGASGRSNTSSRSGASGHRSALSGRTSASGRSGKSSKASDGSIDDEISALLATTSKRLDIDDAGTM